ACARLDVQPVLCSSSRCPSELHSFPTRRSSDLFLANAIHGFGNDLADGLVGVGGDGAYLRDGLGVGAGLGQILQLGNNGSGGLVDTALQIHRVHAGGNSLQTFGNDGLGQNGSSSGTVTGVIVGTGGNVLDQLRTHVLEAVLQLDFLGNGNAVLGDQRSTEAALDQNVAALGPQGGLDRVGQNVNPFQHLVASGDVKQYFFSSHFHFPSMNSLADERWRLSLRGHRRFRIRS